MGEFRKTSNGGSDTPSTLDALEERFIARHLLEWRSPGAAHWPFAGDGPWHLIQGEAVDHAGHTSITLLERPDGRLLEMRKFDTPRPRTPLNAAEVTELDLVTRWYQFAGDVLDRRLLHLATRQLHKGEGQVPWKELNRWLGNPRSPTALAQRYKRAMARVLCAINGWPENRVRKLAQAWDWRPVEAEAGYV